MSASFEDTVFDFDLNFLNQPTTSNTVSFVDLRLEAYIFVLFVHVLM